MPSEREKMLAGELYKALDPELVTARNRARDLCQALNRTREEEEVELEGDRAELLQHEIDHLDGVLAVDRAHGLDPFCLREEWNRHYAAQGRYGDPEPRNASYATPLGGLL